MSMRTEVAWKEKRRSINNLVECRLKKHLNSSSKQSLVILDDNMFYRSMRYEYFQLARKFEVGFCQIYMPSSLNDCLKFNKLKENPVPKNTIIKMNGSLEVPNPKKNKWENNSLNMNKNVENEDWMSLENMINICFLNPIKNVEGTCQKTQNPTIMHQVDIALRKIVNTIVRERKMSEKSEISYKKLAKIRLQVLENVRTGKIVLPAISEGSSETINSEFLYSCVASAAHDL